MSDTEVEEQPSRARDARPRRRRSCCWRGGGHRGVNAAVVLLAAVMTASRVNVQAANEYDLIVVNILATGEQLKRKSCPIECSGTLLTPVMVLTAASCTLTGEITTDNNGNASTTTTPSNVLNTTTEIELTTININTKVKAVPKPRVSPCVRRKFRYLSVCLCAQVFVNHPTFNTESYRIVTDKYLHPLWNPTTRVADLVLLKLRSNLPAYKTVIMPVILDNHLSKKPDILQFKGFGKINEDGNSVWMHGSTSMDDNNMLRSLKIEQWNSNVTSCSISKEDAPNMWSFLCTKPPNVRTFVNNTLCINDVGGPLFHVQAPQSGEKPKPRLYGIFSHIQHSMSPFCATRICKILSKAPFPCREENMFYKYTALLERFGEWVKLTIEQATLTSTDGPTRNCLTERTTTTTQVTTLDPEYDVDVYSDQRFMVANQEVCPKKSSSSACVPPPAGVILTAYTIVGLVLTAARN